MQRIVLNVPTNTNWLAGAIGLRHSSTSISQQFDEAQKRLQTLTTSPGNEAKLKLYGLFKQATIGTVNTKRPGMTDFVGKAKWDAWKALGSMTQVEFNCWFCESILYLLVYLYGSLFFTFQDEAKQKYIAYVDSLVGPAVKSSVNEVADTPAQSSSVAEGFEVSMNGKLKVIKFNKPQKKNALSTDMYSSLAKVNLK